MNQRTDWLSASRAAQLSMSLNWKRVLGQNASAKVPPGAVSELDSRITAGNTALSTAQNETQIRRLGAGRRGTRTGHSPVHSRGLL
jgi:hypothetical protein